ncbi:hypothetical protein TVAG_418480 [Trichomonas vaginalis G3]|uniref:Surface antigen BspA-like n=1 Tax=Trichomonas vaginalis (strain ATCC PRA-98 / G3) TaxID=412133 RepID=A2E7B8_TRIV3|nr:ribonuclease inhibitor domain-containing protein [Trichomonas vaginalis G3]EAY11411.1 hypothetical protein TVAG_418480 [Trichomonas vaginalis G3]KAI5498611.1 ribonuclease inhibitor domain-containing protein [Trichomonas vaginalis G3]|eukprot:XP_001323634.1 hypothetical protein [Trichomonas vaginalis G3]
MSTLFIHDSIRYYVFSNFVKIGYDEYNYSGEPTAALSKTAVSGHLIIERYFNGLPITNLSQDGFYRCYLLTRLTIKANIKVIPAGCFADCYSLTHIDIPPSVEIIEKRGLMFWNITGALINESLHFTNSTSTVIFQHGSKLHTLEPEIFGYIEKNNSNF